MRSRTFDVPLDVMGDFAQMVDDNELANEIDGVADNGDIIVTVDYEPYEKKIIENIHELIDRYNDTREEEENEEKEEENEEEEEEPEELDDEDEDREY
jgi:hypothetical protein